MRNLTGLTWREVRDVADGGGIALLPIGSQEQHSEHLPMGTDTMLVSAVVDAAAELLATDGDGPELVRLPELPYGHSPHHLFAAAVSLSAATLGAVLADVLDSLARSGFRRVLVVNGHGGNDEAMRLAVKRYALDTDVTLAACSYWQISAGEGSAAERPEVTPGHAGWFETSLMLAARPELVRTPVAERRPVDPPPLFDRPPYPGLTVERHGEWARVGGATDDASGASGDAGGELLADRARGLVAAIRAFDATTRDRPGVSGGGTGTGRPPEAAPVRAQAPAPRGDDDTRDSDREPHGDSEAHGDRGEGTA